MRLAWQVLIAIATCSLVALGVAELLAPGTVPVSVEPLVLTAIGAVLLGYAAYVVSRGGDETGGRETPDPEYPAPSAVPGEDLAETLRRFPAAGGDTWMPGTSLQSRLRRAAIIVLSQDRRTSHEEAVEQVDSGTWTDDEDVGAFLRSGGLGAPTLLRRARTALPGASPEERLAERAVEEILSVATERDLRTEDGTSDGMDLAPSDFPDDPDEVGPPTVEAAPHVGTRVGTRRTTGHWRGVLAVTALCVGAGLLLQRPAVLLAGVLGLAYGAYARVGGGTDLSLAVERTVDKESLEPGETTDVSVSVTNDCESWLPDLRIIDGVPPTLAVVEGTPRHGTALRPGESATFTYTVEVTRGNHQFESMLVLARSLSGALEREHVVPASGEIRCLGPVESAVEEVPLRMRATPYTGPDDTRRGSEGVEFRGVREYRPGDPTGRIDWNRRARTGELTTIEFREQRAATVVLGVDDRSLAYVAPEPYATHAVDRSLAAARRAFGRLLDDGHRVGIVSLGRPDCYLGPGAGDGHRLEGERFLAEQFPPVPAPTRVTMPRWERELLKRLPEGAQLVVFSPLADAAVGAALIRLETKGVPVTVVSPDQTSTAGRYGRLERLRRSLVASNLRARGVPVLEFGPTESFEHALRRGGRR